MDAIAAGMNGHVTGLVADPLPAPAAARLGPLTRHFWVVVHRWAGLTITLFLVVAGITGAVMPFEEPLSLATLPSLSRAAPPVPGAAPLDGVAIAERVERQLPVTVGYIPLDVPRDHVVRLYVGPRAGHPPPGFDVVWADPYSGAIRLTYTFGGVRDGPQNIVPFLYALHYGFVAGPWGVITFGIAALIWTMDCFVGFALTMPTGGGRRLARWRHAFAIRRWSGFKFTFDLHRAGGLWLWPLLLVFAWSGVALALPQVERPVMRAFGAETEPTRPPLAKPLDSPPIDRRAAIAAGMSAMRTLGQRDGFTVERPAGLFYTPFDGSYHVYARTSLDPGDEGRSVMLIDARDGRPMRFDPPTGRTKADGLMAWLTMLHMAEVWGLPWKIAVSAIGLAVTALSITGVLIWQRKRAAQAATRRRLHPVRQPRGPRRNANASAPIEIRIAAASTSPP